MHHVLAGTEVGVFFLWIMTVAAPMIVEAFEPVTEPHVLLVKEYGSREPELKCADVRTYPEVGYGSVES